MVTEWGIKASGEVGSLQLPDATKRAGEFKCDGDPPASRS